MTRVRVAAMGALLSAGCMSALGVDFDARLRAEAALPTDLDAGAPRGPGVVTPSTDAGAQPTNDADASMPVRGDVALRTFAIGRSHQCAIGAGHALYCWGGGGLGVGDSISTRVAPTRVDDVSDATHVFATERSTCSVDRKGALFCWGMPVVPVSEIATAQTKYRPERRAGIRFAIGGAFSQSAHVGCSIDDVGAAACWGDGTEGALGSLQIPFDDRSVPVQQLTSGVTSITGGSSFGCATAGGLVFCWGFAQGGVLGRNIDGVDPMPTAVAFENNQQNDVVVAGAQYVCALGRDHAVACWGVNRDHALGALGDSLLAGKLINYLSRPVPIDAVRGRVQQLVSGDRHLCALLETGTVACWGANDIGQLGRGSVGASTSEIREVPGLFDVDTIAAYQQRTCARTKRGEVYCWGMAAKLDSALHDQDTSSPVLVGTVPLP